MATFWNLIGSVLILLAVICFSVAAVAGLNVFPIDALPVGLVQTLGNASILFEMSASQLFAQFMILLGVMFALTGLMVYFSLMAGSRHAETLRALEAVRRATINRM